MNKKARVAVLFAQAQTRRLEALGIVLGNSNGESFICMPCRIGQYEDCVNTKPLHPHPRPGRKRVYESEAQRKKAYYRRRGRDLRRKGHGARRNRFATTGF